MSKLFAVMVNHTELFDAIVAVGKKFGYASCINIESQNVQYIGFHTDKIMYTSKVSTDVQSYPKVFHACNQFSDFVQEMYKINQKTWKVGRYTVIMKGKHLIVDDTFINFDTVKEIYEELKKVQ